MEKEKRTDGERRGCFPIVLSLPQSLVYASPQSMDSSLRSIRALIWLYFWLLLWEGALRKWVFPSLSAPLLVVRDPVVILIYALAIANGVFPWNRVVQATCALSIVSLAASLLVFNNLPITLFGLRTNFLHIPLIFVMPRVLTYRDILKMGRWLLILSIPMAFLVAWQFKSAPDAWVNKAVGGNLGGQMLAVGERIRPPGIFSFVTGMVSFLGVVAAYLFSGLLTKRQLSPWLRRTVPAVLIISVILSASRSALAGVTIIIVAMLLICSMRLARFRHLIAPAIGCYLLYVCLSFLPIFQEGIQIHQERFEAGGGVQRGIIARYLGTLGESVEAAGRVPLFGYGLGIGTNAGSTLLVGGREFLLGESEWPRVIGESGPIIGYAYILLRVVISWILIQRTWAPVKRGEGLPFLLMSACILDVLSGQFGQPTTLGFAIFTAGLALAAVRPPSRGIARDRPMEVTALNSRAVNRMKATKLAHPTNPGSVAVNLETPPSPDSAPDYKRTMQGRSAIARALIENTSDRSEQSEPVVQRDVQIPKTKCVGNQKERNQ